MCISITEGRLWSIEMIYWGVILIVSASLSNIRLNVLFIAAAQWQRIIRLQID